MREGFTFVAEEIPDLGWRAFDVESPGREVVGRSIDELRAAIEAISLEYLASHRSKSGTFIAAYTWEDNFEDRFDAEPRPEPPRGNQAPTFEISGAPGAFAATSTDTPVRLESDTLAGLMERARSAIPSATKVGYFERLIFEAASIPIPSSNGSTNDPYVDTEGVGEFLRSRVGIWVITLALFAAIWWLISPTTDLLGVYRALIALVVTVVPAFAPIALVHYRLPPVASWDLLNGGQKTAFLLAAGAWALLWSAASIGVLHSWLPE